MTTRHDTFNETMSRIETLKGQLELAIERYLDTPPVDKRGNPQPPDPKVIGYALQSLTAVARFEREIALADEPITTDAIAMVPWNLEG